MKKILIHRYILVCLFLSFFSILQGQENASIVGTVFSEVDEALAGVNVGLKNTTKGTTTNKNGNFVLENLAAGEYTIMLTSIGFEDNIKTITVKANEKKQMTLLLKPSMTMMREIFISGEALDPKNRTITVNEISRAEIQSLNIDLPVRLIEQVPGVDLLSYNQGGVADQFSIRGFGGGGHEGQAGAQIDGVSLNEAEGHSDGYADLNILIPLNLEKVKIYKGPSSVLFGRFAEGGTLAFETRKGGDYQDVSLTGGSYNTLNAQFALGKGISLGEMERKLQTNLAFQFFQSDGYAENSDYIRGNLTGRIAYNITDKTDVALSLLAHRSEWDAAGYISEARINNESLRNTQETNAENDGGSKQFYSQRVDVNHTLNDDLRLLVFGYTVQQDFTRFAKFGLQPGGQKESFNTRNVYASGASLNGSNNLGSIEMDWIAGAEFYSEGTERMRWQSSQRVRGNEIEKRNFDVQTLSFYLQGEFNINQYLRPSIGLRYDKFFGAFTNNDPGQQPFTNEIGQLSNVTPKLGLRSTILEGLDLRLSASSGFSLPNSALKYEPNLNLDPVRLWQYELGAGYTGVNWLELDIVGYILNTSNEILESPPGSGDLVNIGETTRMGIETEAVIKPMQGVRIRGTFSYTDTEVMINTEEPLVGKALVNIPQTIATFDVSYALRNGLGSRFAIRDVGPYFTNSDNSAGYDGYTVSNLTLFYNFNQFSANKGRIFVEIRNLFDAKYSETVFGDVGSQIFTPAPTRNLTAGVSYNF